MNTYPVGFAYVDPPGLSKVFSKKSGTWQTIDLDWEITARLYLGKQELLTVNWDAYDIQIYGSTNEGASWAGRGLYDEEYPWEMNGYGNHLITYTQNALLAYDSLDYGATWGEVRSFAPIADYALTHLYHRTFIDERGKLHFIHRLSAFPRYWVYYGSDDFGVTWHDAVQLTTMYVEYLFARAGHVFAICSGFPEGSGEVRIVVFYSHDDGFTWDATEAFAVPENYGYNCCACLSEGGLYIAASYLDGNESHIMEYVSTDWRGSGEPTFTQQWAVSMYDVWHPVGDISVVQGLGGTVNWVGGDDRFFYATVASDYYLPCPFRIYEVTKTGTFNLIEEYASSDWIQSWKTVTLYMPGGGYAFWW